MSATALQLQLDVIKVKLKQLLDRHFALQKERTALLAEKTKLLQLLEQKESDIKQLKQERDLLAGGMHEWSAAEKKLFSQRIDLYLKEIDKCLALINE